MFYQTVTGQIEQEGEIFPFIFDSGSESSLLKESISLKFSGQRIHNTVALVGGGQSNVYSTLQITSRATIDDYLLEIKFHIVADNYLSSDILIGREIIKSGYSVHLTGSKVKLFMIETVYLQCNFC